VKNSFIGFNLRQIQDVIDYADLYKIEGAIIFRDFSKAVDSLEWDFKFGTLKHFRFNESLLSCFHIKIVPWKYRLLCVRLKTTISIRKSLKMLRG
jgi:hypothetical protein